MFLTKHARAKSFHLTNDYRSAVTIDTESISCRQTIGLNARDFNMTNTSIKSINNVRTDLRQHFVLFIRGGSRQNTCPQKSNVWLGWNNRCHQTFVHKTIKRDKGIAWWFLKVSLELGLALPLKVSVWLTTGRGCTPVVHWAINAQPVCSRFD